jgi:putative membrane protein
MPPEVSLIVVAIVAALHIGFLVLEMFFWTGPRGLGVCVGGMTEDDAKASASLAMNQGLYNGFLAAGLGWSIFAGSMGLSLKVFFLTCVVVAGIFGAFTVKPINWTLLLGQGLVGGLGLGIVWLCQA